MTTTPPVQRLMASASAPSASLWMCVRVCAGMRVCKHVSRVIGHSIHLCAASPWIDAFLGGSTACAFLYRAQATGTDPPHTQGAVWQAQASPQRCHMPSPFANVLDSALPSQEASRALLPQARHTHQRLQYSAVRISATGAGTEASFGPGCSAGTSCAGAAPPRGRGRASRCVRCASLYVVLACALLALPCAPSPSPVQIVGGLIHDEHMGILPHGGGQHQLHLRDACAGGGAAGEKSVCVCSGWLGGGCSHRPPGKQTHRACGLQCDSSPARRRRNSGAAAAFLGFVVFLRFAVPSLGVHMTYDMPSQAQVCG